MNDMLDHEIIAALADILDEAPAAASRPLHGGGLPVPAADPFDEMTDRTAPVGRAPSRWLLVTTATIAALLVGAVLVATRTDPDGRRAASVPTTTEGEPAVSTAAAAPASNDPTPSVPGATAVPGVASPSTTAPPATLPRLAVTEPGATLLFGSIFRNSKTSGGSIIGDDKTSGGCCYQQVFRPSDGGRTGPPAVWLYDGESNLADNFVGPDVRAVSVGADSGKIRERARGDQTFIELLFHPVPGRRAFLLSIGLTSEEVLTMAGSLVARTGAGYDVGTRPAGLVPTIEGPLGMLWADEQTQVAYRVAGGGTVGITQFDSGPDMLEEIIASALGSDASVETRTVDGREAIALITSSAEGRRVRLLFPAAYGWVDLALRDVPEDREAAVLASIRAIPTADYEAAVRSHPPMTPDAPGSPAQTMP